MDFFCVECQKKHDVREIGLDIMAIIEEELGSNLTATNKDELPDKLFSSLRRMGDTGDDNETLSLFLGGLKKFIEDRKNSRKFYICGKDILDTAKEQRENGILKKGKLASSPIRLENVTEESSEESSTVSGYYQLTLGDLAEKYIASDPKHQKENSELYSQYLAKYGADAKDDLVYRKKMNFIFKVSGVDSSRILTGVFDENHVPFQTNNGEKLGMKRICSHCGRRLPAVLGLAPEIIVGLIGGPRAGKTSCMTAVIAALYNGNYSNLGLGLDVYTEDPSWISLKAEIDKYNANLKITKTDDHDVEVPSYSFLLSLGKPPHKSNCVLTFVDMPGEFWQKDGTGITKEFYAKYSQLYNSIDCVWSVISTLSVNDVNLGDKSETAERLKAETSEDEKIVANSSYIYLRNNFRNLQEHLKRGKIPPTVILISKTDCAIQERQYEREAKAYRLFPVGEDVRYSNRKDVESVFMPDDDFTLNGKEFFGFGRDARQYIGDKNPALLNAIEESCPDRFYVAMAAYGKKANEPTPGKANTPAYSGGQRPSPYHEIFPLLWTLCITGKLVMHHPCEHRTKGIFGGTKSVTKSSKSLLYDYRRDQSNGLDEDIAYNFMMHGGPGELYRTSKI